MSNRIGSQIAIASPLIGTVTSVRAMTSVTPAGPPAALTGARSRRSHPRRAHDARRLLRARKIKIRVHRHTDDIQLRECLVIEIERAIMQNIALRTF